MTADRETCLRVQGTRVARGDGKTGYPVNGPVAATGTAVVRHSFLAEPIADILRRAVG